MCNQFYYLFFVSVSGYIIFNAKNFNFRFSFLKLEFKRWQVSENKNKSTLRSCNKIPDLESQVSFLQETNILTKSQTCNKCNTVNGDIIYEKRYAYVRCNTCWSKTSIRKGTLLSRSKMSLRRFILLCYTFVQWTWTYAQGRYQYQ